MQNVGIQPCGITKSARFGLDGAKSDRTLFTTLSAKLNGLRCDPVGRLFVDEGDGVVLEAEM
jgi:hypothetical protein